MEEERPPSSNFWKELVKLVILSIIIVIPFRAYIARPFLVDGSSMYPTFKNGQYLIVDELSYNLKTPERGSVLIFNYPKDPCDSIITQITERKRSSCRRFIKRVIGLPGETVSIKDGEVTIVNAEHPEGFALDESYVELSKPDTATYLLEEDEYFVMGDNRSASADSRIWGGVPKENIVGRPILRFYPPAFMPGRISTEVNNNNP